MTGWVLAIDFGTSSTAAVIAVDGRTEVVEVGGAPRVPSVVAALEDETLVAGEAAVRQLAVAPERVERAPKRRLGDRAVLLGDRVVAPTALVAAVLALVADEAIRRRGGQPPTVVRLTHPASWASTRLEALQAAAAQAGLPPCELLAEPVAAAMHLSDGRIGVGDHVAVYDLGGGTFDAAVLRRTESGFDLVGPPGGHDRVGGEDLDEKLLEHVGESIRSQDAEAWERLRFSDERAWRRAAASLRTEVRVAKESLSAAPHATVYVPAPVDLEVRVTREELEMLVRPDLDRTVDELVATIDRAGSPALQAIYLVGGGSRMPLVGRLVAERTGITPSTWGDPKASVALGAAVSPGVAEAPEGVLPQPIVTSAIPVVAPVSVAPVEPEPAGLPEAPAQRRGRRRVLLGASAVALVAVTAAALLLAGSEDGPPVQAATPLPVAAYEFAPASGSGVTSTRQWSLDASNTTLTNETVINNVGKTALTRTAIEVVPKGVAATVADVQFEPGFTVVQDDPVVRYEVRLAPGRSRTLRWTRRLAAPIDQVAFTTLARAQGEAEDAFAPVLRSLVPAAVLAKAPVIPFKTGADPGPTTSPSPQAIATLTPTKGPLSTRQPAPSSAPTNVPATRLSPPPTTVAPNRAPTLKAISSLTASEATRPSVTARGTDPDGDRLTYSASGLPAGLSISSSTGSLTGSISVAAAGGTPKSSGGVVIASQPFRVKVTVKDPKGLADTVSFTLTVRDTKGLMPNFVGKYGDGSQGLPNVTSLGTLDPKCSQHDGSVPEGAIWRQGVAPATVITYGQSIKYWYVNDSNEPNCPYNVAKGW